MAEIFVKGLGTFRIKGDTPSEVEARAIRDMINERQGIRVRPTPRDPTPTPQGAVRGRDIRAKAQRRPIEGPLGIVPKGIRREVRKTIEDAPGLLSLLAEISPSVGGAVAGGIAGAPLGPAGVLGGMMLGGMAGELIGQETGIAPRSETNLALAGAGPLIGRGAGAALRLVRKGAGKAVTMPPPVKAARSRFQAQAKAGELDSLGTQILAKQKGLMARPASELYAAASRSGVVITGEQLSGTRAAIAALKAEIQPISAFPEPRQAIRLIEQLERTLSGEVSFEILIASRQAIGVAIRKAESSAGIKLGSAKRVFASFADDLDRLAAFGVGRPKASKAARLAIAAVRRAKLQFAVDDMEALVVRFTTPIQGGGTTINIKGLFKSLLDITNPKSANFNKNFTAALKDELPDILKNLKVLAEVTGSASPGGPGSIVIRGITARFGRTVVGVATGGLLGGPTGAAVGGLLGAAGPEMIAAALMNKPAMAFLTKAATLGKGAINARAWQTVGQILTRAAGTRQERPPRTRVQR